ncbi:hypothetical protein A2501_01070 [Candidatus Uhrbacteria bacterium RIFOXYC12_FULL_57_11]|nr:MAG: hypothetical protein A2501_01070 [Candidatus Uhrbacteria bacterium RIFOXYC12_FULL_57_11]
MTIREIPGVCSLHWPYVFDSIDDGRGISTCLVAALIRDAVDRRCSHVDFQVAPGNVPAVKTYVRLGFRGTTNLLFAKKLI